MIHFARLITTVLAMGLLLNRCNSLVPALPQTIHLTEQKGCGSTVELKAGDMLELMLAGNPTTGYVWEISSSVPTVIRPVGEPEYKANSAALGAGGIYTFRFQAVAAGQAQLKLIYHRPFERATPPLKTCDVTVVVK